METKQLQTAYTLCFILNEELSHVLLIRKQHPEWQKNLLNGIGGKLNPKEDYLDCASRETFEECRLAIPTGNWNNFAELIGSDFIVMCYYTVVDGDVFSSYKSGTDEIVMPYETRDIIDARIDVIPNVAVLLSLALMHINNQIYGWQNCYTKLIY